MLRRSPGKRMSPRCPPAGDVGSLPRPGGDVALSLTSSRGLGEARAAGGAAGGTAGGAAGGAAGGGATFLAAPLCAAFQAAIVFFLRIFMASLCSSLAALHAASSASYVACRTESSAAFLTRLGRCGLGPGPLGAGDRPFSLGERRGDMGFTMVHWEPDFTPSFLVLEPGFRAGIASPTVVGEVFSLCSL